MGDFSFQNYHVIALKCPFFNKEIGKCSLASSFKKKKQKPTEIVPEKDL
jgi:hypothetical protein